MAGDRAEARRVTLPPAGLLFAALAMGALVLMVVLLVLMLAGIGSLQSSIDETNERLELSNDRVTDINREFQPIAELSPDFLREGLPFLDTTREDLEDVASAIPALNRTIDALAASVIPFVDQLQGAPVNTTLVRANGTLMEIDRLALLADADRALEAVPGVLRAVDAVQGEVAQVQGSVDALRGDFREVLTIFCASLEHLRSIDRKTGGDVTDPQEGPEPPPEPCRDREGD